MRVQVPQVAQMTYEEWKSKVHLYVKTTDKQIDSMNGKQEYELNTDPEIFAEIIMDLDWIDWN